ncbi:hypothetical protein BG015_000438 [Linnemannia schmuckeri]|uniref:Uncharacterized protein n=1 Tax=Linnemannia schmuckeri TaxID=64567 RepID=A0A9P5RTJ0_9FUNG|nr:hypothetical protein BG015_000438 [Linnemannia schmuckeri]
MSMVPPSLRTHVASKLPSHADDFFSDEDWERAYDKSSRNSTPKVIENSFDDTGSLAHKQETLLQANQFDLPLTTSSSSSFQSNKTSRNSLPLDLFDLPLAPSASSSPKTNKTRTVQADDNQGLRTKLADRNGDLNILDTKFYQETKAVKDLQTERVHLEERISRAQDMRGMMEQRLSNLKTQKERETKTVEDLKTSLANMELELSSLRMAIDVSKRELEFAQADKSSFLTALANGQEESLELKAALQKNCDEVLKLKQDLESRMSMLGLDPLDFPGTSGGLKGVALQVEAAAQNGRVPRGPHGTQNSENQSRCGLGAGVHKIMGTFKELG